VRHGVLGTASPDVLAAGVPSAGVPSIPLCIIDLPFVLCISFMACGQIKGATVALKDGNAATGQAEGMTCLTTAKHM
jgi:hypothetical protein